MKLTNQFKTSHKLYLAVHQLGQSVLPALSQALGKEDNNMARCLAFRGYFVPSLKTKHLHSINSDA